MGEIDVAACLGHQHQTQGKKACEHQTDHSVFLDPGFLLHKADGGHGTHTENKGPERKGQAKGIGHHHAGQHRMGHGIPHQRPALEGHVAGQQTADASHQGAHQQCPHHEGMTEGFQQPVHSGHNGIVLILNHGRDG